jgi:hypothetical protein
VEENNLDPKATMLFYLSIGNEHEVSKKYSLIEYCSEAKGRADLRAMLEREFNEYGRRHEKNLRRSFATT